MKQFLKHKLNLIGLGIVLIASVAVVTAPIAVLADTSCGPGASPVVPPHDPSSSPPPAICCPTDSSPQKNQNGQEACCPKNTTILSNSPSCCPNNTDNNSNSCLFSKYINPFIGLLSAAVGVVVVIGVIVGSIEFTTSGGDPQRVAAGRQHITNSLLGLVAYLLLYLFLEFLIPGGFLHG